MKCILSDEEESALAGALHQQQAVSYGQCQFGADGYPFSNTVDGLFYDLLLLKGDERKKLTHCACRKSQCLSGYCDCRSKGMPCGKDCGCLACGNRTAPEWVNPTPRGCKCTKSHCLKHYCQCFRQGLKCDPSCECANCSNS